MMINHTSTLKLFLKMRLSSNIVKVARLAGDCGWPVARFGCRFNHLVLMGSNQPLAP
jgi:membrane-associated PAP2 superfamily phosphatase